MFVLQQWSIKSNLSPVSLHRRHPQLSEPGYSLKICPSFLEASAAAVEEGEAVIVAVALVAVVAEVTTAGID
jgi:hypothetical protein